MSSVFSKVRRKIEYIHNKKQLMITLLSREGGKNMARQCLAMKRQPPCLIHL